MFCYIIFLLEIYFGESLKLQSLRWAYRLPIRKTFEQKKHEELQVFLSLRWLVKIVRNVIVMQHVMILL